MSHFITLKTSENPQISDVFKGVYKKNSSMKWVKQRRRKRASSNKKTKTRQNENIQRNNMIKNKQISFEVTRAWHC